MNMPDYTKQKIIDRVTELQSRGLNKDQAVAQTLKEIDQHFKAASDNALLAIDKLEMDNYKSVAAKDWQKDLINSDYAVEIVENELYYLGTRVQRVRELILEHDKPVCLLLKRGAYRDCNHFALYNIVYEKEYEDLNQALLELNDWIQAQPDPK